MRKITAFGLFMLLLASTGMLETNAQVKRPHRKNRSSVMPQALPVYNLLKALDTNDFNLYVSTQSSEKKEKYPRRFDKRNWKDIRENEIEVWRDELKGRGRRGLRFKFEGSDWEGEVIITRAGREISRQAVIREKGEWKIKLVEIFPPTTPPNNSFNPTAS